MPQIISQDDLAKLVEQAIAVRQLAYAPYSNFQVGAALLGEDGSIFRGANVENGSYGLTICAERVAACNAISAGHRDWLAIAIACDKQAAPCGACRQFLSEFGLSLRVILIDPADPKKHDEMSLNELLPNPFSLE